MNRKRKMEVVINGGSKDWRHVVASQRSADILCKFHMVQLVVLSKMNNHQHKTVERGCTMFRLPNQLFVDSQCMLFHPFLLILMLFCDYTTSCGCRSNQGSSQSLIVHHAMLAHGPI